MSEERPAGCRFWEAEDVADWVKEHAPDRTDEPMEAAIWWCVYRNTEQLVDDTIRHIAQSLKDGVGPFDETDVTEMVQQWWDNYSGDVDAVNTAIEHDLAAFFLSGRILEREQKA